MDRAIRANTSQSIEAQAETLLNELDISEKIKLIGGQPTCGATFGCERIGLPEIRMADGPMGVHWWSSDAIAYPALICATATWDPSLWRSLGRALGRDCRARGVHILLAPGVNIYRSPLCGRNFEYCGEDPYLASRVAVEFIRGVQEQGVSCTVKHFAANFQEYDRHQVSSDLDERTLHEIYLPAFKAAVIEAECGAVMTAYNPLNGEHCSQNRHLILDILKGSWNFRGLVMSDWTSTYDAVAAANAGLDLEMPMADQMCGSNLIPAIEAGTVGQEVIDDKVRRLLRLALRFGWLNSDQHDPTISHSDTENQSVALEIARAGIVLLKNTNAVLPLASDRVRTLAVVGPNSHPAVYSGGGAALTNASRTLSVLDGLNQALGDRVKVVHATGTARNPLRAAFEGCQFESDLGDGLRGEYFDGKAFAGTPSRTDLDRKIDFKWGPSTPLRGSQCVEFSVRWTGRIRVARSGPYTFYTKAFDNACRIWLDDELLVDSWNGELHGVCKHSKVLSNTQAHPVRIEWSKTKYWSGMQFGVRFENEATSDLDECVRLASDADAAIICVGFNEETEGEGFDRPFALEPEQEALIKAVARAQPNSVVVLNAGGGVDMRGWLDDAPALIHAFYPGQEGGQAIAEVILGDRNPSGKLPITIERNPEDRSSYDCYHPVDGTRSVRFSDKLSVGYRHFDEQAIEPLFPFGFGLSYTQFTLENLRLSRPELRNSESVEVSVDVVNLGARAGSEVVQVYVSDLGASVPRPTKELKGIAKVSVEPGQRVTVNVRLERGAFEFYDPEQHEFVVEAGRFAVLVGHSSAHTPLRAELIVHGDEA